MSGFSSTVECYTNSSTVEYYFVKFKENLKQNKVKKYGNEEKIIEFLFIPVPWQSRSTSTALFTLILVYACRI